MADNGSNRFLMTANFYKIPNKSFLLGPKNMNPEGDTYVKLEGMPVKKQEQMSSQKQVTQKIYVIELHMKLGHPGEYRMRSIVKHLHYITKVTIYV